MIVNLDVTLRDGGYRNNFDFPLDYALHHARESVAAGLEWVEIGYRNGSFTTKPGLGRTGVGADDYIRAVAEVVSPDRLCMILHPKNITEDDLPAMYGAGVRLVRFCLPSGAPETGLALLSRAAELGFTTTVNITRVSQLDRRRLVELAGMSADAGADVVYLADSNGSMLPDEVSQLVTLVRSVTDTAVGLHAHNNLGLALANAIAAVDAGATWIDSSILGMGKGPGNLVTEQWLAYLGRGTGGDTYDLGRILGLAHRMESEIEQATPSLPLPDLVLGHFDLSVEERAKLPVDRIGDVFSAARELTAAGAR
ncbi:nucleoid-structuring protein H-NS [Streptomyces spiroverticillatus]|uniref:Nucleoid-structuring protein H-NS n=1 Tax=Streptomyces finlayi TaxID=67296 RepID=A0A918WTD1_9ACTN|nr:3-hydroxy-3-methylglutaryl-CoA lyase [Streptomyces finlayi]GGZ89969.1 nucleoid-structuring protein H-NS [Streptomyces spiroverticillatus]GHC80751.1 nucleoid-structuring protein H-NS [Streptomyces finlayi]